MKRIILNMAPYWHIVLIILVFLGIQAYCDLALPQYTSDMIDVGIQNHGVEYILPEKMTEEDMLYSTLFMTDEEKQKWEGMFTQNGELYERSASEKELENSSEDFLIPIVLTHQTGNMSEERFKSTLKESMANSPEQSPEELDIDNLTLDEISEYMHLDLKTHEDKDEKGILTTYVDMRPIMLGLISNGQLNTEQISTIRSQMEDTVSAVGSNTMKSLGIAYAISADKAAGVDVDEIQKSYLWLQGAKMLCMALLMLAASVGAGFFAARTGAGIGRDLREKIFKKVIGYSNTEIDKFSTASLITRSTNDVQQIQMVTALLLRVLMYAPILGIGGVIKVLNTGAHMGWIIIAAVAIILMFVLVLMLIAMPKFKIMQKLVDGLNLISREILTGLSVIRAFGREKEEEKRFDKANTDLMKTQLFTNRVMTFMMPGMMLVMYGVSLTIVWVSAHRIDTGDLQVGAMTAFISYSIQIVMSFLMLTVMSVILPRAGVAADRIDEVLKTDTTIVEPESPKAITSSTGTVCFDNVSFKYPNADDNALSNISFTAESGKTTAIIGSTGCGKSTLINLIPRFYDVTEGSITVDGVDVRELSKSDLRSRIGLVPQKGVLFSGTISSNLKFGKPDASEAELEKAAETAQAMEFISGDENGFERAISQGGSNVSGGQKQRLAIARAIVKSPEIYIFDDSFSALDMKTDAALRKELEKYVKNSAVIIVAQRISTIMNADQILVLDEGRIVGKGTHKELMKSCDTYKQIAGSQLSEEEIKKSIGGEDNE
ncbi:ABC transporter ATP-binding protein [Ruminococcus flavefaciens]|uniref:ABC transporter ATP-binding protein n=1 Tax=Ruminococcus flavefaciens TaxID=1265 RepID=UPI0026ECE7C1|nr:ABC transporter ATP-binding protein [Ruminococcus flavefaciens]MDD7517690.1 ABC transporter ATP-binding protein [Ruminococcus flavefaciens]MDY5690491.1 ABC transporter ATP-binding protein [Ruminococcus flavefaciens]